MKKYLPYLIVSAAAVTIAVLYFRWKKQDSQQRNATAALGVDTPWGNLNYAPGAPLPCLVPPCPTA